MSRITDSDPGTARAWAIGGLAVAGLLALAGCAKATTAGSRSSPSPSPSPSPNPAITISVASVPGAGNVLVNGTGQTLYLLTAEQGGTLACTSAACLHAWPDVTLTAGAGAAIPGPGITPSLLGTVKDASGASLVTYGGWPLHTFIGDTGPGTDKGNGLVSFGGTWEVVTAGGTGVTPPPASPAPTPSPAATHAPAVVPTHPAVAPPPSPTTAAPPPSPQPTYTYGYGY